MAGDSVTPEIRQAMEELNVISQNDLERERYLARVEVERDQLSRLDSAREEGLVEGLKKGREEGRQEGQLIGTIHLCQHPRNAAKCTPS